MFLQKCTFFRLQIEHNKYFVLNFCTLKSMKVVVKACVVLSLGFALVSPMFSTSFARAEESSTERTKVKKKLPQKKKQEEVISKNLPPSEQQRLSQQRWSFLLGTYTSRSLDELSDYSGTVSGSVTYMVKPGFLLSSSLSYEYLVYKDGGSFLVNEDDPRQFGINDIRVGFSLPRLINLPNIKSFVNLSGGVSLPTSQSSRDATQYFGASTTLSMISFLSPKLLLSSFTSMSVAAHQFEEANFAGTALNSPFGVSVGASLSYNLIKGLTSFANYSVNSRHEYGNGFRNIQSVSTGLQYALSNKIYLSGSYFWRDQFVSNDVAFDDDKSFYSLGIDYIL